VQAPPKSRYATLLERKPREAPKVAEVGPVDSDDEEVGDDEELSDASQELDYDDEEDDDEEGSDEEDEEVSDEAGTDDGDDDEAVEDAVEEPVAVSGIEDKADKPKRERKRKRKDENEDLEEKYFSKLVDNDDDDAAPAEKRQKSNGEKNTTEDDDDAIPQHESLAKDSAPSDIEKANRTVFLANVSTTAINSKSAKKELMKHLASPLDNEASPPETVESLRFRSVAFGGGSMPKRAAYITKQLMDATTKSMNAYAVYSTAAAARKAVTKLNGSVVLDRHIRVDSVAHPTPADHRRCVFVGNLGFVDDESVLNTDGDGETTKKKRNKVPSDIEEGLWRTFSTQGAVENVRVIRDPKTRVGKGFAYVQFQVSAPCVLQTLFSCLMLTLVSQDGNAVESALLLDGKKFPPMLPRALRVTRAKNPRKTATAQERQREKMLAASNDSKSTKYKKKLTPEEKSMTGRAGRLLGRSAAAAQGRRANGKERRNRPDFRTRENAVDGLKTPEQIVFEGSRASAMNGRPKDLKLGKKARGKSGKPTGRAARRTAEWRKKQ
jgi:nucleolar protein 12